MWPNAIGEDEPLDLIESSDWDISGWDKLASVFDGEDIVDRTASILSPYRPKPTLAAAAGFPPYGRPACVAATDAVCGSHNATPVSYTTTNVMVDASNPDALYLPMQKISFQPTGGSGHEEPVTVIVGPAILSSKAMGQQRLPPSGTPTSLLQEMFYNRTVSSTTSSRLTQSLEAKSHCAMFDVKPMDSGWSDCSPNTTPSMSVGRMGGNSTGNEFHADDVKLSHTFHSMANDTKGFLKQALCMEPLPFDASESSHPPVTHSTSWPVEQRPALIKPLTPYNYFYRVERDNIVHGMNKPGDPLPPPMNDLSATKMKELLYQHWYVDPLKGKRQHRKQHGKIDFPTLSKVIAHRWRTLSASGKDFYRQVSRADHEQFTLHASNDTMPRP